jgi:hypothetical protein
MDVKNMLLGMILLIGLSALVINLGESKEITPQIKYVYVNATSDPQVIVHETNVTVEKVVYIDREIIKEVNITKVNFTKPTKWELKDLVMDSHVSGKAYDNETYDCTEYSNELVRYLKDKGVFSCTTEINFQDGKGHMGVMVELEDGRLMYVEPQDAELLESKYLNIGDDYCEKFDWNCDWEDEIVKISSCYEVKLK